MIVVSRFLVPRGYAALTLYPFIFVRVNRNRENRILLNHESIHLRQQIEMLVIPFYLLYILEFIIRFIGCRNWNQAYRSISFEKEAFVNEKDLDYLKSRPFWNFYKYIF